MALADLKLPSKLTVTPQKTVPANVVTITPKMAEEMLGKNTSNRRIDKRTVDGYARDMDAGDWKFTGDAIKFGRDGSLLDGQHRLMACVKSEVPFVSLVVVDLDNDAKLVMDTGRNRTFADVLTMQGQTFASRIGAACGYLSHIKKGKYDRGTAKITNSERMAMFNKHQGLNESAHFVGTVYGMSTSLLITLHYIGDKILDNGPFANEFAMIFATGNSYDGCAAHAWRERLVRSRATKTPITHAHMFNGSIHAWNLFSASRTVKLFRAPENATIDGLDVSKI